VSLVEQWNRVETGLDPRWSDARLSLRIAPAAARTRAAALLAPAGPGVAGDEIRVTVTRGGGGVGPEALRRLLRRIDAEGLDGALEVVSAAKTQPAAPVADASLARDWDAAVAALPSDWSDLLCELALESSGDVDRAAVLAGPLNPIRDSGRPGFRFRSASRRGYGAAPGMVRRCLERLDAEEIGGELRIARVLCDTHPVGAHGPVWHAGRRPA
jgi:hypothetical protein